MPKRDPRIDDYIAKAPEFAKPILAYIRETAHSAVPDIEETVKWGTPFFEHEGTLAMMAAFKQHMRFGFWKGKLVGLPAIEKLTSIGELPSKKDLAAYFRKAAALNERGVKVGRKPKSAKAPAKTPSDLAAALKKNRKAAAVWEKFAPSHRREYVDWITGAKTDETRRRRLEQAIEWIAEAKQRNWKYRK